MNTDTYSWEATYYANGVGPSNGNDASVGTTGGSNNKEQNETASDLRPDNSGLSGGAIAGIVVGIIAVVSLQKKITAT